MTTMRLVLLSSWFQLVWFLAVLGREQWLMLTWVFVASTLLISIVRSDFKVGRFFALLVVGVAVDYVNTLSGLFVFESTLFPLWLVALWAIFLWYAYYLLPVLNRYPIWVVSVMSGVAGALSYYAGVKFGAVQFPNSAATTLTILSIEWVVIINIIRKGYGYESGPENHTRGVGQ